jgi:hypothetical protein
MSSPEALEKRVRFYRTQLWNFFESIVKINTKADRDTLAREIEKLKEDAKFTRNMMQDATHPINKD